MTDLGQIANRCLHELIDPVDVGEEKKKDRLT
jgi:hypothetical protein